MRPELGGSMLRHAFSTILFLAAALSPGEVGGEIFDMDLHPGPVGGEQVQGQAPFLDDQDGPVALGG